MKDHVYTALFPFGGIGGGALGFLRAQTHLLGHEARFRVIGGIDFDKASGRDFERIVGAPSLCADIAHLSAIELRQLCPDVPDVVFLSPPCLPGHVPVVTPRGPVPIQDIRANDLVLTHKGRFRRVAKVGAHVYDGMIHGIRLHGTVDVQEFTSEHPMWVRRPRCPVIDGKQQRRPGIAQFMAAGKLRVGDRVGYPIDAEVAGTATRFIQSLGDPCIVKKITKHGSHEMRDARVRDLRMAATTDDLWFLIGAYLGDGYRRASRHETIFCVGPATSELAESVRGSLERLGLKWFEDRNGGATNIKIRVTARHLCAVMARFGDGAESKRIPPELMGLDRGVLDALIAGCRASDGSEKPTARRKGKLSSASWKVVSISLQLLRDLQRLLLRRGEFGAIHVAWPGGPQKIMGRIVQTRPRWEVRVTEKTRRGTYDFLDGCVWVRIRKIEERKGLERVWNLEVEEDNTFCVPMMATHNCKGASGLLGAEKAKTAKYQAMNRLALDWIELMLTAWDGLPRLVLLENVPRLKQRAASMLTKVRSLLRAAGYVFHDGFHDCGELGGLAQRRRRYLLVARLQSSVPPLLYQPPKKRVRGCGEVLGQLPLPGATSAGPMHALPNLSWLNWVRLALIPAGGDWRDLDGVLRGGQPRREVFKRHGVQDWSEPSATVAGSGSNGPSAVADPRVGPFKGSMGVRGWDQPAATVTGESHPSNGANSLADPRVKKWFGNVLKVRGWEEPASTVTGGNSPSNGGGSVADPRLSFTCSDQAHRNKFKVAAWDDAAPSVIGATRPGSGAPSVADPRIPGADVISVTKAYDHGYGVLRWDEPSSTVAGGSQVGQGAYSVADLRFKGEYYNGTYGVMSWQEAAGTITGSARIDTGRFVVADPRKPPDFTPVIIAADGTWHRPLTTLELAAIQGFPVTLNGEPLVLTGKSITGWRERIGNAVPPPAAQAIAEQMLVTLLQADIGAFTLASGGDVWVERGAIDA